MPPGTNGAGTITLSASTSWSALLKQVQRRRWWAFAIYLAAQAFVVAGLVTPEYPDSAGYLHLSFTGSDLRLWTVPLFYTIFRSDPIRIAAQVVLAAACWWYLARAAARLVGDRRVRVGLEIVLLTLGLVSPVAQFNSTILSDSVALSLSALVIGTWITYFRSRTSAHAAVVLATTLFWTFTRNDLVLVGIAVTVVLLVTTALRFRQTVHIALAVGCVAISAYGLAIDGRNTYVANANIADVIEDRVLPNLGWTEWFIGQGMPYSAQIKATEGGLYGLDLMAIPSFESWLSANGARTYAAFMATHPGYTLWDPLPDFTGEQATINYPNRTPYPSTQPNPTPSMLSPTVSYGRHREVVPAVIEGLLFEQGQIGDVIVLAAAALALGLAARRRYGKDRRLWVPIAVIASAIPQGYIIWLTGGDGETDRHSIVLATTLRIGLWIAAAFGADRLVRRPADLPPQEASP